MNKGATLRKRAHGNSTSAVQGCKICEDPGAILQQKAVLMLMQPLVRATLFDQSVFTELST